MSIELEIALALGLTVVLRILVYIIRWVDGGGTQSPELFGAMLVLWGVTIFDVVRKLRGKDGIF